MERLPFRKATRVLLLLPPGHWVVILSIAACAARAAANWL